MRGLVLGVVLAASAVAVSPALAIAPSGGILDGGFEAEGANALTGSGNSYCYFQNLGDGVPYCGEGNDTPWSGGTGLIASGSAPWGSTPSADGSGFYSFVQGDGTLTQTFRAANSGEFVLNWVDHSRTGPGNDGPSTYSVSIDPAFVETLTLLAVTPPATIGTYTSTGDWLGRASDPFSLIGGQTYTLTFTGLNDIDRTAFIDNVALSAAVPEPASWAMMIGGFGLVGGAMRARRKAGSPAIA